MLSRRHCHGSLSGVVLATSRLPAALYRRFATTVKGYRSVAARAIRHRAALSCAGPMVDAVSSGARVVVVP